MNTDDFHEKIMELLREKQIATEKLTRDQLAEAIRQALLCGDFERHVQWDSGAQCVNYIPYRESERLKSQLADAQEFLRMINKLRSGEGDSVTILCDNPDFNGQPNCAIECCGDWTGWEDRRFTGDTVLECLRKAVEAKP